MESFHIAWPNIIWGWNIQNVNVFQQKIHNSNWNSLPFQEISIEDSRSWVNEWCWCDSEMNEKISQNSCCRFEKARKKIYLTLNERKATCFCFSTTSSFTKRSLKRPTLNFQTSKKPKCNYSEGKSICVTLLTGVSSRVQTLNKNVKNINTRDLKERKK